MVDISQLLQGLGASIFHRKQLQAILVVIIVICITGMIFITDLPGRQRRVTTSNSKTITNSSILPSMPHSHIDHDELDAYIGEVLSFIQNICLYIQEAKYDDVHDIYLETKETVTTSYTAFLEARQSKTIKEAVSKYRYVCDGYCT